MSLLIIAEHDNNELKPSTLNTIAAAQKISDDIHVLIAGSQCQSVVEQTVQVESVQKVLGHLVEELPSDQLKIGAELLYQHVAHAV